MSGITTLANPTMVPGVSVQGLPLPKALWFRIHIPATPCLDRGPQLANLGLARRLLDFRPSLEQQL
jgi:hypothetical protein